MTDASAVRCERLTKRYGDVTAVMPATSVHRVVERQAAIRHGHIAITSDGSSLTYREFNQRANAAARYLVACGLRRASWVIVAMPRSPELACVLLAILKAGAAYMWVGDDEDCGCPGLVCLTQAPDGKPIVVDVDALVAASSRLAPNLPIVTRPGDIACILPRQSGVPAVMVPHETITALQSCPVSDDAVWSGDHGALDLWVPLMAGASVAVAAAPPATAAA